MSVAHLIYNVPSPEPSTWIKPSHLILTIIIPILQMRKLRPRDVNKSEYCWEGLNSGHLPQMPTIGWTQKTLISQELLGN